jgi:hypothetical protein
MRIVGMAAGLTAMAACSGGSATCGPAECASVCASSGSGAPAGPTLTAFEAQVMGAALDDVRLGIRPWDDKSVGICKGQDRNCDEYLGTSVDVLPEGEYMLRAEMRVPKVGDKGVWRLHLKTECTTTRTGPNGTSSSTNANERDYDEMVYAGEEHGSRISPMYRITSPNSSGAQECTWTLTSNDADHPATWSGKWSVPAKE